MKNIQTDQEIKDVGLTTDEQKAYLESRPYKARRTGLYKGKFAKPGHAYLVVKVKWKDRTYERAEMFPAAELDPGVMNHLYDKIYDSIKEYHQEIGHKLENRKK